MPESVQESEGVTEGAVEAMRLGAEIPEEPEGPQTVDAATGAAAARDGLPESGEPTPKQANDALASMLSSEPPPLPTEVFEMKELAERMKVAEFPVTLRALNDAELEQISDRSTKAPTKEQRKMGVTTGAPDTQRMKRLIVATGMVSPALSNPALLEKYGPQPEHVVRRWFLSGEIDQLCEKINDLSGFGAGAVERAK
jgi:hypothetical protein